MQIFQEIIAAINDYHLDKIGLLRLIDRLVELVDRLDDTGYTWKCDVDQYLTEMEIIYSLLASGDKEAYSQKDTDDIEFFLKTIESEIAENSVLNSKLLN